MLPYSLTSVFLLGSNQLSNPKHFVKKHHRTITLPDNQKTYSQLVTKYSLKQFIMLVKSMQAKI